MMRLRWWIGAGAGARLGVGQAPGWGVGAGCVSSLLCYLPACMHVLVCLPDCACLTVLVILWMMFHIDLCGSCIPACV